MIPMTSHELRKNVTFRFDLENKSFNEGKKQAISQSIILAFSKNGIFLQVLVSSTWTSDIYVYMKYTQNGRSVYNLQQV